MLPSSRVGAISAIGIALLLVSPRVAAQAEPPAPEAARPKICLVLSGGGARGKKRRFGQGWRSACGASSRSSAR